LPRRFGDRLEDGELDWHATSIRQAVYMRNHIKVVGRHSMWYCHIVEHEDNEMMRPYRIGPVQPGQPGLPDKVERRAFRPGTASEPVNTIDSTTRRADDGRTRWWMGTK
jgi:hypothetical protein